MKIVNEYHTADWAEYDFTVMTAFQADQAVEALKAAGYVVSYSGSDTVTITNIGPYVNKARAIIEAL